MDFLTKKELNGLKGDLKASEYALNAEKEHFKKELTEFYGKQMEESFNKNEIKKEETKEKKCFLRRLFSI